jgi:tetratricopeptide (TPR) repeat protein
MFKKKLAVAVLVLALLISSLNVFAAPQLNEELINKIQTMDELGRNGKYEECIQAADRLLAEDKYLMTAYECKSMAYFKLGKTQEAYEVLVEQLNINPRNQTALYNAACSCSILGKKDKANEYLKTLLELNITEKNVVLKDSDLKNLSETDEFKRLTGISVRVGGELLVPDVPPIIINGRTMIPMRAIFEALGAELSWDGKARKVSAVKGSITISATIDNKVAYVNNTAKELETPPVIINDRTLVPVRFISEALGAKVNWDPDNKLVDILTDAPAGIEDNYDGVKQQLDNLITVSVVDGIWPEPYHLDTTEGLTLIIAKDKKALDLMNTLSPNLRAKYMYEVTMDNYALLVGCEVAHMKFVLDGKVYYEGDMYYEKNGEGIILTYFEKGLPINVVKQYKMTANYKDYYLLPKEEQVTSKIGD